MKNIFSTLRVVTLFFFSYNSAGAQMHEAEKPKVADTFMYVEKMPVYKGGHEAAMKFIRENIQYPLAAKEAKEEGRVMIKFVVTSSGAVRDVKCLNEEKSMILCREAVRVVSAMPDWQPGYQDGRAVNVFYTLPIVFKLK